MKNYWLFSLLLMFCIACSTRKDATQKLTNGIVYEYYPSGKVLTKTSYVNGKRHGVTEKYHENGTLYWKANFFEDKYHGIYTWFDYKNGVNYIRKIDYYTMNILTKSNEYGGGFPSFVGFNSLVYTETYDSNGNMLKKKWRELKNVIIFGQSVNPSVINKSQLSIKIKKSPIHYENTVIFLEYIYSLSNNTCIKKVPDEFSSLTPKERDSLYSMSNCIVRRDTINMRKKSDTIIDMLMIEDSKKYFRKIIVNTINFNNDTTDCHQTMYVLD